MSQEDKAAKSKRAQRARSAAVLGAVLPLLGLLSGFMGLALGGLIVNTTNQNASDSPFLIFAITLTWLSGGTVAGAIALAFVSHQVEAHESRRNHLRIAALVWLILCAILPLIGFFFIFKADESLKFAALGVASLFTWGVLMALSLAAYVRYRSISFDPDRLRSAVAGGVLLSFLPLFTGVISNKVWIIIPILFLVAGIWAGTVTYFILRPRKVNEI